MSRTLPVPPEAAAVRRLKEGLVALWRDESTIQIGLDPDRATVVGEVAPETAAVLPLLARGIARTDLDDFDAPAQAMVDLLDRRGLLTDESDQPLTALNDDTRERCSDEIAALALGARVPAAGPGLFAARRTRRVLVRGAGRVGTGVAHLLAASGIGRVTVEDENRVTASDVCPGGASGADIGLRRSAAATALAVRALPPALNAGASDLALLCVDGPIAPPPQSWAELVDAGTATLPVIIRESTAIIGPLIVPGRPDLSGCPFCADRHRTDRDPSWPLLAAQLHASPARSPAPAVMTWATAALAVGQSLQWLDRHFSTVDASSEPGLPEVACVGATLELNPAHWTWRRRWWGPHPECSCVRAAA